MHDLLSFGHVLKAYRKACDLTQHLVELLTTQLGVPAEARATFLQMARMGTCGVTS